MADVQIPPLLDALLRTAAPSGREGPVADLLTASLPDGVEVSRDRIGSLLMRLAGRTAKRPRLAIVGHMDEVGMMVTGFDEDGRVAFGPGGGLTDEVLIGQRVAIRTATGDVPGVIGLEPNWYPNRHDETPAPLKIQDMRIDLGAADAAEAATLVQGGDAAVIDVAPIHLAHGRIASRAIDNRFGMYVATEVIRRLAKDGGGPTDVVGIGTVQEETAFAGAHTVANAAKPDLAVVVDADYARPAPREDGWPTDGLGAGALLFRGTVVDDDMAKRLIAIAEREGIRHSVRSYPGSTLTDADVLAMTRTGVPTAVMSVALRYMHSPVEVAQLDDIEQVVRLLVAFAETLDSES